MVKDIRYSCKSTLLNIRWPSPIYKSPQNVPPATELCKDRDKMKRLLLSSLGPSASDWALVVRTTQ